MRSTGALLVMAKRPLPGQTKTRLLPDFSAQESAQLYACFLHDTIHLVQSVPHFTPFIAYAPASEVAYFEQHYPDCLLIPQRGETLGERLDYVLSTCLQFGYEFVCAMNSDSPTLPAAYLEMAFSALQDETTDVVFGPCEDGGYYLIGCKRPYPQLVRDVTMSTDHVLEDTLAIAHQLKLKVQLLPAWYDVDTSADVERVQLELAFNTDGAQHTRQFLLERQPS